MKNLLQSIYHFLTWLNEKIGQGVSWLTTALVLLFCYDVVMRYLFSSTAVWITELEWHLFSLIFLLGAAYAYRHDKHVRVDVFYNRFSDKGKAIINLLGILIFLIPWCLVIIKGSQNYAYYSWTLMEGSPNPGGLPYRFLIKFSITFGFILLFLQAVAELCKSILTISE